ncbi:MAG: response regulator [Chloroflexi bacterium]|nr:MAG: response regulator [Chloroflexota bacterium]
MSKKVLVIEDNEKNIYLVTLILEQHGYQVFQARDGINGIKKAETINPNLILLDIQLPGLNGYAVARRIRSVPKLEHTPIIAVTSFAMVGDREKAFEAGCTGYIEKPINLDTFIEEVENSFS